MGNFEIFGLQMALSFAVYILIARWYVAPWLAKKPLQEALIPLLVLHALRHLGMTILVPTVTSPDLPRAWATQLAYGDLVAGLLALASMLALQARWSFAVALVWIFNVEGTLDLLGALYGGLRVDAPNLPAGSFWYVPTFVVPALLVTHAMMFSMLLKHRRVGRAAR